MYEVKNIDKIFQRNRFVRQPENRFKARLPILFFDIIDIMEKSWLTFPTDTSSRNFVTNYMLHRIFRQKFVYSVFLRDVGLFHYASNKISYHRKDCFIPPYSLYCELIWAFLSHEKAFSVTYKIVFLDIRHMICLYLVYYVDVSKNARTFTDGFLFESGRFSATSRCPNIPSLSTLL